MAQHYTFRRIFDELHKVGDLVQGGAIDVNEFPFSKLMDKGKCHARKASRCEMEIGRDE